MAETILIVDPYKASQQAIVDTLKTGRYQTVVANAFAPAAQLLESVRPDLLITAERLGSFSGLELVRRGRLLNRRMAALVIRVASRKNPDWAKRDGVVALTRPVDADELLRAVSKALGNRERRKWARTTLASNILARIGTTRARMHNVSYGGARLESRMGEFPSRVTLEVPSIGVSLGAKRVWSGGAESGGARSCGIAVATRDAGATRRWRGLVDRLQRRIPILGTS